MTGEQLPWPLMYENKAGMPDDPFDGIATHLTRLAGLPEHEWRCHELDRSDAEGAPTFLPHAGNIAFFAAETFTREGYARCRSFIADARVQHWLSDTHASLLANVFRRFGAVGLKRFADCLEMFCDGWEADRRERQTDA